MKQNITREQYQELSDKAKIKLIEWIVTWTKDTDKITLPHQDMNIGRMIEFLVENTNRAEDTLAIDAGEHQFCVYHLNKPDHFTCPELCDALWEAVKQVLEVNNG